MADVHSSSVRSYNMSRIRSKDTKPELLVRRFLFAKGFRFRLHDKTLPGKPDLVLRKYRTIIFVHGCFWHGHEGCRYFVMPATRQTWWGKKIFGNREKDECRVKQLSAMGWKVEIIWACRLKGDLAEVTLNDLVKRLNDDNSNNR
jgi:DNA mismatch endonuclease (patch repair protein)